MIKTRKKSKRKGKLATSTRSKPKSTKKTSQTRKRDNFTVRKSTIQTRRSKMNHLKKRDNEEFGLASKSTLDALSLEDEGTPAEISLFMNRLIDYPRDADQEHLVTLRDLAWIGKKRPSSILTTTFGYELEYIKFLLKRSKVGRFSYVFFQIFVLYCWFYVVFYLWL